MAIDDLQRWVDYNTETAALPMWVDNTRAAAMAQAQYAPARVKPYDLIDMLRVRLRITPHEKLPFDHIHAVRIPDTDTVVVLVINNKQHVVIEDGYELFPSDKLVTQLRLLAK